MWFGEKHKEALATLKYGILDNKGFLLLTGDVGTGKTTLINTLVQSVSDDIICTSVPDPGLEKLDFFNYIAAGFGIDHEFFTKGTFLAFFRKFLIEANANNKKVLLIIDEAQLLTQEMLEEIRLLSNIEKTDAKLINIFFVGQNEFNEILNREQNRAVRQRLTLNYNIEPLTPDETGEYIRHRLSVAGTTGPIFDDSAIQEVFMHSGGFPRRINVICDHSLLSGYVREQKIINATIVKECAKELKIPEYIKNRYINGFSNDYERPVSVVVSPRISPDQPKQTGNRKKGRAPFVLTTMCLVIVLLACFHLFPDSYQDSMIILNKEAVILKSKLLQIIPESYLSFIEDTTHEKRAKEAVKDTAEGGNRLTKIIVNKKNKIKTDGDLTAIESISIGEILHPINKEVLKGNDGAHIFQTENEIESTIINKEKVSEKLPKTETIKDTTFPLEGVSEDRITKLEKEILPLPRENVIIRFRYNTNDFTNEGYKNLTRFADILTAYPETKINISGYTDSEGYQKYNQRLSEFRANIVGSFLLGRGIHSDQMIIKGLGSQNPIEKNDTAWGRMMNRRVEIEIVAHKMEEK